MSYLLGLLLLAWIILQLVYNIVLILKNLL
jgi:hypothetical protein